MYTIVTQYCESALLSTRKNRSLNVTSKGLVDPAGARSKIKETNKIIQTLLDHITT